MKLPIPIYPTRQEPRDAAILRRLHQPGRFTDKPIQPVTLALIFISVLAAFCFIATGYNLFTR